MLKLDKTTPLGSNIHYFLKWTFISCVIGVTVGVIGAVFGKGVAWVTNFWNAHAWTLFLAPLAGLLIVWLYHMFHEEGNRGTNLVLESISADEEVTLATAPLIFVSTLLTHFVSASAGREGAALQLGGSLGEQLGKWLRLDEKDRKVAVMCGMSACFAALFGTPLAAGVFSMEVISIGVMYYAALVPCVFASFLGAGIAESLGLSGEQFLVSSVPAFGWKGAAAAVVLGMLCAVVSIGFCMLLHRTEQLYRKYFENPYLRICAAALFLIVLTAAAGTRDYNGSSMGLIEAAMEGRVFWGAFLIKALFTALTIGAGYRGGEIVPTLCVGASFGGLFGMVTGLSPSLCAACGMAALFVGVTNCPITSALLIFEMCGFEAMPYFALSIAVSFTLSGYYGLYKSQKFVYSKIRTEFINRKANP